MRSLTVKLIECGLCQDINIVIINDGVVQTSKPSEVAELRWDGPIQTIPGKVPKRQRTNENTQWTAIILRVNHADHQRNEILRRRTVRFSTALASQ